MSSKYTVRKAMFFYKDRFAKRVWSAWYWAYPIFLMDFVNLPNQAHGNCFRSKRDFFSLQTSLMLRFASSPRAMFMYTFSSRSPFRKAFLRSSCYLATIVLSLATKPKVSLQFILYDTVNLFEQVWLVVSQCFHLPYANSKSPLTGNSFLSRRRSEITHVSFFSSALISSLIAYFHSRFLSAC